MKLLGTICLVCGIVLLFCGIVCLFAKVSPLIMGGSILLSIVLNSVGITMLTTKSK